MFSPNLSLYHSYGSKDKGIGCSSMGWTDIVRLLTGSAELIDMQDLGRRVLDRGRRNDEIKALLIAAGAS